MSTWTKPILESIEDALPNRCYAPWIPLKEYINLDLAAMCLNLPIESTLIYISKSKYIHGVISPLGTYFIHPQYLDALYYERKTKELKEELEKQQEAFKIKYPTYTLPEFLSLE